MKQIITTTVQRPSYPPFIYTLLQKLLREPGLAYNFIDPNSSADPDRKAQPFWENKKLASIVAKANHL